MSGLHLTENEYSLVCLVLEEPPMPRAELVCLASRRLFLEPEETDALVPELLSRDVLAPEEGRIVSRVTREAADRAALDRALNTFTPRWPAPNPPPEAEPPAEEPAPESPPRPKKRVWRWVVVLLLCAAAGAVVWFLLLRDRYPKLVTFEDGRTFSQLVKPESDAQKAAAQYLMEYARDRQWASTPMLQSLELTGMLEFTTDAHWAAQVETYESYASITAYDIAAEHRGVVIFAEAEVSFTDDGPALLEDGTRLYRLYLSEEDGVWTVEEMKETEQADGFFVEGEDLTVDGRTVTISRWGRNLTGGICQIYAVTAFDGETRELLYLTEEPAQQDSTLAVTFYDLNDDGCEDLLFNGNYPLCYLYAPEAGGFRLSSLLSGRWLQYDPALPGAVEYTYSTEGTATRYFYRIVDGDTLEELARLDVSASPSDGGDELTYFYTYHEGDQPTETYTLMMNTSDPSNTFCLAMAYLEPWLLWDEVLIRTAQKAGCLELPKPLTVSASVTASEIQLIYMDITENLALYTSPNGFLLLRDELGYQVLPGDPRSSRVLDYDGDGDSDVLSSLTAVGTPVVMLNGGSGWSTEALDLTFIVEEFNQNTTVTYSEEDTGETFTIAYSGQYGSASYACPAEALSSSSHDFRPDTAAISPESCTVQGVQSLGQERRITFSFPVILTQDGVWRALDASFCCEITLSSPGGDAWSLHSMHLIRQPGDH